MWITWNEYIRIYKLASKFLNRAHKGMDRGQCSTAFYKWRQLMVNETHAEYDENIEELKNRQETQEIAIRKTKEELVECEGGKTKITAQTKSLSRKIMANFIARMVHMRMA